VNADDAPNYPQTDEEAELRAELLRLHDEGIRVARAFADLEVDVDQLLAGDAPRRARVRAIEAELGLPLSYVPRT
jgi:hypothetical protein